MTNRLDFEKVRTRSITNQNPVENALSALASRSATSMGLTLTHKTRRVAFFVLGTAQHKKRTTRHAGARKTRFL